MRILQALALAMLACASIPVMAIVPGHGHPLHDREFRHDTLWWGSVYQPVSELESQAASRFSPALNRLGARSERAFVDPRTGRFGTLIITRPLIPGSGVGNDLQWSDFDRAPPRTTADRERITARAIEAFVEHHADELRLDPLELAEPRVQAINDRLTQIHIARQVDGIPVRDSYLTASVNSGNLVLMGQRNWGAIELETRPAITADEADEVLRGHLSWLSHPRLRTEPSLAIVPVATEPDQSRLAGIDDGLDYRLAWVLKPDFRGHFGGWEALVDAHSGELLSFVDTNQYHSDPLDNPAGKTGGLLQSRSLTGGVLPVGDDGSKPGGVEQPGYPMPFADVTLDGEAIGTTSPGGNAPGGDQEGTLATSLSGPFVTIDDNCGNISESSDSGDLDLGDGGGSDCAVPDGGSSGNTLSSRTSFYGLNRIIEQARGYLPSNPWLQQTLTSNMNINNSCNAFWNGTVNFFTSGTSSGTSCGNTGEVMAVVHHEWGHGMDANSANPGISQPGEGIADIYAQNMLNDSCIGRGFFEDGQCTGFGDPCLECSGVRESDWAKQESGEPHDIDWVLSSTGSEGGGCSAPGTPSGGAPCGSSVHCEGSIIAEALWDLVHRDLRGFEGSAFDYDLNTALALGTQLTYEGAGNVGAWFQCNPGDSSGGGCNADGGYLQYLAADADNGSIEDGTPHMSAIRAAFDRHQLACDTPVVQDAGCEDGPAQAPQNLAATALDEGVELEWDAVDGADAYRIYRAEGPTGCDFGKARVGTTDQTSFGEDGLLNDFDVHYGVIAVGGNSACTSPMSACVSATPNMGPSGTVSGTVTRADSGEPLADFLVTANGDLSFSTRTDDSGQYQLTVLEDSYTLEVTGPGFIPASTESGPVNENDALTVDFSLDAPRLELAASELDFSVGEGGQVESPLVIANTGTAELAWSLATDRAAGAAALARDAHDPDLDEALQLADFDLPGDGSHTETLEGGLDSAGMVTGFSFTGTVSGVSGTGTWASDLAMTLTSPDDRTFSVGGYQTQNPPWDFDGEGSDNDGSYSSTHIGSGIFGEDGALDAGDWTFDFEHTWNDAMDWSDVTVTLHKVALPICQDPSDVSWLSASPDIGQAAPGSDSLTSVSVDAAELELGEHAAWLCLQSNDPDTPLLPIEVRVTVSENPEAVIEGAVSSLGYCADDPAPLESAEILIDGQQQSYQLSSDAAGEYAITLPTDEGPVDITVSADGHVDRSLEGVGLASSSTLDFELLLEAPCAAVTPSALSLTLVAGDSGSGELAIGNIDGGAGLDWNLGLADSAEACDSIAAVDWLAASPESGKVAAGESHPVEVLVDASQLPIGDYSAWLCIDTGDEAIERFEIPVELEVLAVEVFGDRFEPGPGD